MVNRTWSTSRRFTNLCLDLRRVLNEHSTQFHVDQQIQRHVSAVRVHVARTVGARRPRKEFALLVIFEVG